MQGTRVVCEVGAKEGKSKGQCRCARIDESSHWYRSAILSFCSAQHMDGRLRLAVVLALEDVGGRSDLGRVILLSD